MRTSLLLPAAVAGLVFSPLSEAAIQNVIHISCDGLRGDLLRDYMAATPANYPGFGRLKAEGSSTFNARSDFDRTETLPNHCGMVTGRPSSDPVGVTGVAHNYNSNGYTGTATSGDSIHQYPAATAVYAYKQSTFDTAHDRGRSTAFYAGKTRLNIVAHSYNVSKGAPDTIGANNGTNKIDFASVADLSSAAQLATIRSGIVGDIAAGTLRNYTFIHLTDADTGAAGGGHSATWGSTAWQGATRDLDSYVKAILDALDASTAANIKGKTAIILTADHGGGNPTNNHTVASDVKNYTIPFFVWGPGVPGNQDALKLFRNRFDPDVSRPTASNVADQPLRNLDSSNLAMTLLGLPEIQGSYFKPELEATPKLIQSGGNVTVSWPGYLTGYTVEASADLNAASWAPVAGTVTETTSEYRLTTTADANRKYWRLKRPE